MGIWTWTMKIGMNHDEAAKKGDVTNHEWDMEIFASYIIGGTLPDTPTMFPKKPSQRWYPEVNSHWITHF